MAGQIIDYMNTVRADSFADVAAKAKAIKRSRAWTCPTPVVNRIVTLPGPAWERVAAEIQVVLERAMREEIRENTLADERRKVAARVRLDLADEDAAIVTEVVQDLLVPNSFLQSRNGPNRRRKEARDAVEPAAADLRAQRSDPPCGRHRQRIGRRGAAGVGLAAAHVVVARVLDRGQVSCCLLGLIFLYYLWRMEPQLWLRRSEVLLLGSVLAVFMLAAKIAIPAAHRRAVLSSRTPRSASSWRSC